MKAHVLSLIYAEELDMLRVDKDTSTIAFTNFRIRQKNKKVPSEDNREKLLIERTVTELKEEPDLISCVTGEPDL